MVVDLLNNLDTLAEDKQAIASTLQSKIKNYNRKELQRNADKYGTVAVKKFIEKIV